MSRSGSFSGLLVLIGLSVAFVWLSASELPVRMASHFVADGTANAFMPRQGYLLLMTGVLVGAPLLIVLVQASMLAINPRYMNMPNRDYWLAPERLAQTRTYLWNRGIGFAALLVLFLTYVHWVVIQANHLNPPRWPQSLFIAGLVPFVLALLAWILAFFMHFRRGR